MTYTAVYPASPKVHIGTYDIDMVENLRKFKKALVQSLNDVLSGNKRAVVIRIAHVGRDGHCKGVFSERQECIFVPITGDCEQKEPYSEVEYIGVSNEHNKPWKYGYPYGYHADPMIFAKKPNGELVRSITYGENDVEPMIAWIDLWSNERGEVDVSKIDAYMLFNSTLCMDDYKKKFQVIHGGFKAEIWGDISCFGDGKEQCPKFDFRSVADRVEVNPHWLRGDSDGILMMVGDSERWFFSMPIAPPPLYFLAQKKKKIEASKKLIHDLSLQSEERIEKLIGKVDENKKEWLKRFLDAYRRGEDFGIRERVEKLVREYRQMVREEAAKICLSEIGLTPQRIWNKEKRRFEEKYSYLDLVITNDQKIVKEPGYSWGLGLLLLLTIDSYLRRLGKDP